MHALNDINDEREPDKRFAINPDTRLFGKDAVLDSLSLVSVIVDVETALSETAGIEISLTDDRAMSQTQSPFSSVSTLTAYILHVLSESP